MMNRTKEEQEAAEVRSRINNLVLNWKCTLYGPNFVQIRYRAVQDAKEVLGDQVLRAVYDAYGHQVDTDCSQSRPNSCATSG